MKPCIVAWPLTDLVDLLCARAVFLVQRLWFYLALFIGSSFLLRN